MSTVPEIPPRIRAWLYWSGWVLGTITQGTTVVWVSLAAALPEIQMPVWLIVAAAILGFLQSQLNALAGVNLPSYQDVVEGEVEPPRDQTYYDARGRLRRRGHVR